MAWGNVVLSENQNDVEACLAEQAYEVDIPTRGTAESTSSALFEAVPPRDRPAEQRVGVNDGCEGNVGARGSLREVLDLVRTVAPADSTALIEGESGTGMQLTGRAIHNISPRSGHRFVRLN